MAPHETAYASPGLAHEMKTLVKLRVKWTAGRLAKAEAKLIIEASKTFHD
jgi:hypothetical protein